MERALSSSIRSALYHIAQGRTKAVFRLLDHLAIYILIAGTYTPFTLVTLRGSWGWSIFGIVWGLAIIGLIMDSLPRIRNSRRLLPLAVYLLMGWLCVIALGPLLQRLPTAGFVLLLAGGLFYTAGIGFYLYDSPISPFPRHLASVRACRQHQPLLGDSALP